MKAVYEELNGDFAVFAADKEAKVYHVAVSELPEEAKIGDVFEVEVHADEQLRLIRNLPAEREHRLKTNRDKREELLRRKND